MDKLEELLDFLDELKNYREVLTNNDSKLSEYKLEYEKLLKDKSWADFLAKYPLLQKYSSKISKEESKEELRERLVRKSGALSGIIIELTGKQYFSQFMTKYDMWAAAFNPLMQRQKAALVFCINTTNEAIGKLESDIKLGIRDKQGRVIEKLHGIDTEPPKAFIAHGGRSGILNKLREFIEALGIKPIIVELSPTKGMTVDEKVNKYIKDADCGIVLATKGGIVDTKGKQPKQHPRLNVIDELERLRAAFPERTILLVEKGVDLPSNISGLTHEPFVGQSMDRAFTAIARELAEFGILKTIKPQEGV